MSTSFIISLIVNLGLITLCLSMVYPKAIQVYRKRKKLREKQRVKEIQKIVIEYLEELRK